MGQREPLEGAAGASFAAMAENFRNTMFRGRGHGLVHGFGIGPFYKIGRPAITEKQVLQLFVADTRQEGRVVDLVPIEMKDGQNRAIAGRAEELVDVPGGGEGAGFRLAIAHQGRDDQVGIVERGAARLREHVAELSPSWMEPGVSGVQWLPMPPGKENCLKNSRMPSSSWLFSG